MSFDLPEIRNQFPALHGEATFLDNPGGTQIAQPSIDRMLDYLTRCNSNHDGAFATSRQSDALLAEAHAAVADFLNAARPEEIVFGPNMTTLTLSISRAIARTWKPGDEIVVTRLDHDANITPWTLAAEDRGVTVRWVDFHPEDGTLDLEAFQIRPGRQAAPGGGGLCLQRPGHDQPPGGDHPPGPRRGCIGISWMPCSTRRTGRLTSRSWIAISWPARLISSSARM